MFPSLSLSVCVCACVRACGWVVAPNTGSYGLGSHEHQLLHGGCSWSAVKCNPKGAAGKGTGVLCLHRPGLDFAILYQRTERRAGLPCGSGGVLFHRFSCAVLVCGSHRVCVRVRQANGKLEFYNKGAKKLLAIGSTKVKVRVQDPPSVDNQTVAYDVTEQKSNNINLISSRGLNNFWPKVKKLILGLNETQWEYWQAAWRLEPATLRLTCKDVHGKDQNIMKVTRPIPNTPHHTTLHQAGARAPPLTAGDPQPPHRGRAAGTSGHTPNARRALRHAALPACIFPRARPSRPLPFGTSPFGTPHHTTPHNTTPHPTTPRHATPCYTTPHATTPHHTAPHHTTPHHTTPHFCDYCCDNRMV